MKKSALELFVRAYLKQHNSKSAAKIYIEKAIVLIDTKLENPCCTDINAVVDLKTKFDNQLTIGVAAILNTVPLRYNKPSYLRAKSMLQKYIGIGCCVQ